MQQLPPTTTKSQKINNIWRIEAVLQTKAQSDALQSQASNMADSTGDSKENLLPIQTFAEEFHQCSHLALYSGLMADVATFYNFSIVMSRAVLMENCRLIRYMTCTTFKKEVYLTKNGKLEEKKQKTHFIKESIPVALICHKDVFLKVLCTNGLHHLLFGLQHDLPNLQGIPLSCRSSLPVLCHCRIHRNGYLLLKSIRQEMRWAIIARIWKSSNHWTRNLP